MTFDPLQLRRCLGHFASGVTVVSCEGDGQPHGATVNAFSAVSLEPPLVMVSLDRKTRLCKFLDDKPFTVNVLEKPQDQVALHFAGKPMSDEPQWEQPDPDLAPQLVGSLATIACGPWRSYDGGDHVIYLGEIQKFTSTGAEPLVFYLGAFRHLGPVFETVPWLESGDCPGISWFGATA